MGKFHFDPSILEDAVNPSNYWLTSTSTLSSILAIKVNGKMVMRPIIIFKGALVKPVKNNISFYEKAKKKIRKSIKEKDKKKTLSA